MDWLNYSENLLWFGFAALGFAILFNVPNRTLFFIWLIGAACGGVKMFAMHLGAEIILASFAGASLAGILSIPAAHGKHSPPMVFAIPSVIPMVPGAFAYRTMLGLIQLTRIVDEETYSEVLFQTVNNGLKAMLVLVALALGVSVPMLITRRDSAKNLKIPIPSLPKKHS